jgi:hypothetical protein
LPLILFNLIVDMLAIMINRTKEDGQFSGWFHISLMEASLFYGMLMTQFYS